MFHFDICADDSAADGMRREVRSFLRDEQAAGRFTPRTNAWVRADPAFSRRCGERGLIGITWPKRYGGQERSEAERIVVMEEMLAAGAPVGYHWTVDRQCGPQILRLGSERLKAELVPRMAAGRCCVAIGMSEPDTGSDLSSVRTRAEKVDGGWRVHGRKVWTTNAHVADYIIALVRTEPRVEKADRRHGMSQLVIALSGEGIEIRPIYTLGGEREFNEVVFDGAFCPDDAVLGRVGEGWGGVTSELALERSAPDRFMSLAPLLSQLFRDLGPDPDPAVQVELGRLVAMFTTLRAMSGAVARASRSGRDANTEAALVKDIGTSFEQEMPETVRRLTNVMPGATASSGRLSELLAYSILESPSFSLRGGTREVLRGIVARGLGLR